MARTKIAPTIGTILDAAESHMLGKESAALRLARAELRALLAVARAARLLLRFHGTAADVKATSRALVRLDRLSRRKP